MALSLETGIIWGTPLSFRPDIRPKTMALPTAEIYSFECPLCRSTLSIPVVLQGVVGPCPHCFGIIASPQLPVEEIVTSCESSPIAQSIRSPHEAQWNFLEGGVTSEAHPNLLEFVGNAPISPTQDSLTTDWEQQRQAYLDSQKPTECKISSLATREQDALASWAELTGETPSSMETTDSFDGGNVIPLPPLEALPGQRRPWALKVGMLIGLTGMGLGACLVLKPDLLAIKQEFTPTHDSHSEPSLDRGALPAPKEATPVLSRNQNTEVPATQVGEQDPLVEPPDPTEPIPNNPKTAPQTGVVNTGNKTVAPSSPLIDPDQSEFLLPSGNRKVGEQEILIEPRKALEKFLSAATWRERIKYVQNPELTKSRMEHYYQSHADGPVKTDSVDYLTQTDTPDGKSKVFVFRVYLPEGFGFPVSVEQFGNDYRVDWSLFVEFKDLALPKFFEKFSAEPATFHGILRRAHYFGSDVTDQDNKLCFKLDAPVQGYANNVWVDKSNTELITQLGNRVTFQAQESYVTATLRWVKEDSGEAYVSLVRIVSDSWRTEPSRDQVGSTR